MNPTPILVLSHTHLLLPLASRLVNEGHEVTVQVRVPEFEGAWAGAGLDRLPPGADLAPWISQAERGELTVVSDSLDTRTVFSNVPPENRWEMLPTERRPVSGWRLGVWFDGSEPRLLHWLFVDQERGMDVGLTLVWEMGRNLQRLLPLLGELKEEWKRVGFRGLAQVGLQLDPRGGIEAVGAYLGWPPLHTAVFLAGFEGQVPLGDEVVQPYDRLYTLGTLLSLAPWPWLKRPRGGMSADRVDLPVPEELVGAFWWWAVEIDQEAGRLRGAGLDGLLGVARAQAYTLGAAQARLGALVQQCGVPQLQARLTVGSNVPQAQAALEEVGWVILPS